MHLPVVILPAARPSGGLFGLMARAVRPGKGNGIHREVNRAGEEPVAERGAMGWQSGAGPAQTAKKSTRE